MGFMDRCVGCGRDLESGLFCSGECRMKYLADRAALKRGGSVVGQYSPLAGTSIEGRLSSRRGGFGSQRIFW